MKPYIPSLVARVAAPTLYSFAMVYSSANAGNRVGEPMPLAFNSPFLGEERMVEPSRGARCVWLAQRFGRIKDGEETLDYLVVMPSHNSQGTPYLVLNYKENRVLVDNRDSKGNPGTDWVIDRAFSGFNINILDYHPFCAKTQRTVPAKSLNLNSSPKSVSDPSIDNSG